MPFTGPAEDRLAIRELLDSYADAVNRRDHVAWGETWAEDAVWSMPDYPHFPEQHGRDAIVTLWREAMSHYPGIIFVANPGAIEVAGDRATVRSYTSEVYDQDGLCKRDRGVYEDECVKRDGRWVFAKRVFRNLHRHSAERK